MTTSASHRRTRLRTAVAALGATLVLATLTACQDEEADAAASPSPSATTPGEPRENDAADASEGNEEDAAGETDGSDASDAPGDGDDAGETDTGQVGDGGEAGGEIAACTDATTELAVAPVERPINHLLLTVTNTGTTSCLAYHAPHLRFGEAQSALPVSEDSQPQAVVTLAPGETAYAGIMTSNAAGEAGEGHTVTGLGVQLADRAGGGAGDLVDVPLPDGEAYVDPAAQVTYWQSSLDQALFW